jgi:hypothetical protein
LDDVEILRERLGSPPWKGNRRYGRTDDAACAPWLRSDVDFLVHPIVDVPSEDFFKDLRQAPTPGEQEFLTSETVSNQLPLNQR